MVVTQALTDLAHNRFSMGVPYLASFDIQIHGQPSAQLTLQGDSSMIVPGNLGLENYYRRRI